MSPRAPIIAGKTVIVVQVQDAVDATLNKLRTKFQRFGNSIGNLSLNLFSGGILGTAPSGKFLKDFKDFEDKILFLSTKLTASEKDFESLTRKIRDLGRTTSFTASEVADAATVLAQAGLNVRETSDTLQATLDLARGAQITLSQSGEILANTMRSFSMETSQANVVASQFIAAARLGTLDVLDLKESIKEVLGTVRNLNIDLPTTLALLTQMASRSLRGTKAGTSLNTALLQLASKTKVLQKAFKINLGDNISGDRFIVFLEELYNKLMKMGNLRRTAVLQSIFNIRGGRAITALDDIKAIIELRKQITKAGDEARTAAVKMDSGFGGSIRRATSALNDLSITLGKLLAGPVGMVLDKVPALTAAIDHLAVSMPELTLTILAVPPAMLLLGAAGLTLSFTLGKLAGVISLLLGITRPFGSILNKALTAPLVGAALAASKVKKVFQGMDQGLSAAFLTPELIQTGRNAGKVKPSSFLKRAGNTNIPFLKTLGSAGRGLASGAGSLTSLLDTKINAGLDGLGRMSVNLFTSMRRRARTQAREAARRGKYARIAQQTADARLSFNSADQKLINFDKMNQGGLGALFSGNKADTRKVDDALGAARNRLSKINVEMSKLANLGVDGLFDADKLQTEEKLLEEISTQLAKVNAKVRLQEKAYDRLYALRKEISALENSGKLSSGGEALLARLKIRENTLKSIVNVDHSAQQAFFRKQYATTFQNVENLRSQKLSADGTRDGLLRRDRLAAARAAELNNIKQLEAQKAGIVKKVDQDNLNRLDMEGKKQADIESHRKVLVERKERARLKYVKAVAAEEKGIIRMSKVANNFKTGSRLGSLGRSLWSLLGKGMTGGGRGLMATFKGITTGLQAFWRMLKSVDYVSELYKLFSGIGKLTLGILRLANGFRRFVFSASGFFTIIELLIIFGPKIEFIRKAFERLGKGIVNSFKEVGAIFGLIGNGPLQLMGAGFGQLFRGDAAKGVETITESLRVMANIVATQLTAAWYTFVEAIGPALDAVYKSVASLWELVKLLLGGLGSAGGQLGQLFKLDITGGGFRDLFNGATSKEAIVEFLKTIGGGIAEATKIIAGAMYKIVSIITSTMIMIQQSLVWVFDAIAASKSQKFMGYEMNPLKLLGMELNPLVGMRTATGLMNSKNVYAGLKDGYKKAIAGIDEQFGKFGENIDKIFKTDITGAANLNKWKSIQDAMLDAEMARLRLTGEGIDNLFEQIRHALAFPTTSIFASKNTNKAIPGGVPLPPGALAMPHIKPDMIHNALQDARREVFDLENQLNEIIQTNKEFGGNAGLFTPKEIKDKRDMLAAARQRVKDLEKMQKGVIQQPIMRDTLANIVEATVGDISFARNNMFKAAGKNTQQEQTDILKEISAGLGATGQGDPFLQQLVDKAGPLVLAE